jgi:pimeloyl-ACP methyl ester carboxylesterase
MDALDEREPAYSARDRASIRVPTATAVTDHEESVKPDRSSYLASIIPGARLVTIENASHFAPLQNPEGFASAVETFLQSLHSHQSKALKRN